MRRLALTPLLLASLFTLPALTEAQVEVTHSLNNGTIDVGLNSFWGGAIVRLSYQGRATWIDNGRPDPGRAVQTTFYRSNQTYQCFPCNSGCAWGWNPVQAGNCHDDSGSGVTEITATSSTIDSTTQPLQWNPGLGRGNVLVQQVVQFARPNALQLDYTITNNEAFTVEGSKNELPVAYIIPSLGHAFRYQGGNPFELAAASEVSVPVGENALPEFQTTEPWIAWLGNDGVGLGLYAPPVPISEWRFQHLQPAGTTPANAMQFWREIPMAPGAVASHRAYLVAGTLDQIRLAVYSLEAQRTGAAIFAGNFESGTLAGWSSSVTDGGNLSASSSAALRSSGAGLAGVVNDTNGIYVQDDSPDQENHYRARFYFDPNGFDPGEAHSFFRTRVFLGFQESPLRRLMAIVLKRQGGDYALVSTFPPDPNMN